MPKYRVELEIVNRIHVELVTEASAGDAAHRARHRLVADGYTPNQIGRVYAENTEDGHDVWASKGPMIPLAMQEPPR